jgi:hypothetical protein
MALTGGIIASIGGSLILVGQGFGFLAGFFTLGMALRKKPALPALPKPVAA